MILNPKTEDACKLFLEGTLALGRAELAGIRVDIDYVQRKKALIEKKMERFEQQFKNSDFFKDWQKHVKGRININSGSQLKYYLYTILKLEPSKTTPSGEGSTDEESLKSLNIPEINLLLEKVRFKKPLDVLSGFEREQVDGYIHPFFNLNTVVTYRSSSDSPNFQNIPARDEEVMQLCRGALYPRPGHQLLEIDFKSIEVGINACYNHDPTLVKYVSDPKSDMHGDMMKQIFKMDTYDKSNSFHKKLRYATKNGFVFPEFYGSYYKNCANNLVCTWGKLPQTKWSTGQGMKFDEAFTLSDHLISKGINSYKTFENHLKIIEKDFWENRFPDYADWKDRWWRTYKKYGYFDTLTGFRCSGIMVKNDVTNYPAQGSAFHCLLWTLIQLDKVMTQQGWDSRIIGQIHDSCIIDVNPRELNHIVKVANRIATVDLPNHWKWIVVPMNVELEISSVDHSWAEKEGLN